jgi:hypothetical protein
MKVAEALLPKLGEWTPSGSGRHSWTHALAGTRWALHLTADRVDTLGCLVWELTFTQPLGDSIDNSTLKKQAQRIAERVTGLIEPLTFLELDEIRGEALLRSRSPSERGGALAYYEVLLVRGAQIQVRRYKAAERKKREQVSFALTHEAIAKLAEDLVAA